MRRGSVLLAVVGGLLVLCLLVGMMLFSYNNSFVAMEEDMNGRWAQVENQLKRRADLVPNLVETVKGYAGHEKEVFARISDARARLAGAGSVDDKMKASNELTGALSRLLVVAEAYPNLKADASFRGLQDELAGTENRLAVERQRYNEAVQAYNTSLRKVPGSLIAGMMGFKQRVYFEVTAAEKDAPKVKF